VILDVEATHLIRQEEVGSAKTPLDRMMAQFDLHPERLIADSAYVELCILARNAQKVGFAKDQGVPKVDAYGAVGRRIASSQRR